jgi:hypothetical protein
MKRKRAVGRRDGWMRISREKEKKKKKKQEKQGL